MSQHLAGHPQPAAVRRRGRRLPRAVVPLVAAALLLQMAVAMLVAAAQQSPTIDEPVYVGAAAVYTQQHSLRFNPEHPPLGKLLVAAGVAAARPTLDLTGVRDRDQTALGRRLLYESGNDPWRLMLLARIPVIVLTLLAGLVVFAFARDLAGPAAGPAALALYAFSPDLIAHGSLATLDVPAAAFLLTAAWATWRARARPAVWLPVAGVALGAALATRANTLAVVPVVLALAAAAVWWPRPGPGRGWRDGLPRAAAAAAGVAVLAVAVVWLSYLAVDPRLRWTPPASLPDVGGLRGLAVDLLPLPQAYRDGMLIQFGFEDSTFTGFLFGEAYRGSRWYYLPAAVLVKTPLGLLALGAAGTAALLLVRRLRPAAAYVLAVPAVTFAVAMTGARDFGVRYVVVLPMFLAVAAAAVLAVRRRFAPPAVAAGVLAVAVSSALAFPYHLPYANEAFGGPANTHRLLHDSNVDWGQDLGRLADRLRTRYPGEPVWLVYKGAGVPAAYGIAARDPRRVPPEQVRGLLVVSDSSIAKADRQLRALIAGGTRVDTVGHSITIFRR